MTESILETMARVCAERIKEEETNFRRTLFGHFENHFSAGAITLPKDIKPDFKMDARLPTKKLYQVTYKSSCTTYYVIMGKWQFKSASFYADNLKDARDKSLNYVPKKFHNSIVDVKFLREEEEIDHLYLSLRYTMRVGLSKIQTPIFVEPV